jgi:hypothetical protein
MPKSRLVKVCLCLALAATFGAAVTGDAYCSETYNSYGRRDPFVPLVGVTDIVRRGGIEGISSIDAVDLQGIVVSEDGRKGVIMNGEVISEGEVIGLLKVEYVGSNTVVIKIDNDKHELKLYK